MVYIMHCEEDVDRHSEISESAVSPKRWRPSAAVDEENLLLGECKWTKNPVGPAEWAQLKEKSTGLSRSKVHY